MRYERKLDEADDCRQKTAGKVLRKTPAFCTDYERMLAVACGMKCKAKYL